MKLLYFLLFVTFTSFGQTNSIKLTYKAIIKEQIYDDIKNGNQINDFLKNALTSKQEIIKTIKFVLVGNNDYYYLSYKKPMQSEFNSEYSVTGAVSRVFDGNYIFSDLKERTSILGGYDVGVKIDRALSMNDLKWTLFKETKIILDKVCYKAIGFLKSEDLAHAPNYPITAWYCPDFNFQCGPTPFATLPGVIMQLENDKSLIIATSYKLGNFKIKPYKSSHRLMPYSEFNKYMKEWSKENMKIKRN